MTSPLTQPEINCKRETVKSEQAVNGDYRNTGYERWLLNPNSYQCGEGRIATFILTNTAPMNPDKGSFVRPNVTGMVPQTENDSGTWDYFCSAEDPFSALNGRTCKPTHPYNYYSEGYLWCYTTDGS